MLLAIPLLVALILCAYGFVQADRAGPYAWPVRVGSALAFAALCVLIWYAGPQTG